MSSLAEPLALIDRLPDVRGRYGINSPLAPTTWFRVGGPAEVLFRPADLPDLQAFMAACPKDIPITVIGVASNLLVRDGGVPGVVVRLGGAFAEVMADDDRISAGAGALDLNVATVALQASLTGLEFLSGIPGTVGGALRMNAGAYGREVKDVFVKARAVDRKGKLHTLSLNDMNFAYRHCGVPDDFIFIDAMFKGTPDKAEVIEQRMKEIKDKREASQPVRTRTGGSTFANPVGPYPQGANPVGPYPQGANPVGPYPQGANPVGAKAWELIDKAGLRGFKLGGAQVSEQHTNFLINTGGATAADIENLGEEIRRRVKEQSGINLRWEIQRIGVTKGTT